MWNKFECPTTLLPPEIALQIKRPPKKEKKSKGEIAMVKGKKLTRKGKTVTCSNCKGIGHNKRGCKATGSSDDGLRCDMPSETMPSQSLGSQQVATQGVSSQPLVSETIGSQVGPSEAVTRKSFTRKSTSRKYVTRKRAA
ncbi:FAR1-related sequence 10, partial [Tanacetum coccineum]